MLLLCDLEEELEECCLSVDLSYLDGGQVVPLTLPGLIYADDLVLTSGSQSELQQLLDICIRQVGGLGSGLVRKRVR